MSCAGGGGEEEEGVIHDGVFQSRNDREQNLR